MTTVRFHCPFARLSGCRDGGGSGLTKSYLIKHLHDRHCIGEAQTITKHSLLSDLGVFERAEVTLKRMGIWLCGVCFKTHTTRIKCRHGADFVSPPDIGDGVVRFVIYDLAKPLAPSCSQLVHVHSLLLDPHDGLTLSLLDSLFSKGLRTVKSIPPKCRLGFSRVLKGALDKVISKPDDISCWVSLLVLPLCLLKTFSPRSNLECKSANKRRRQEESITNAITSWGVPGGSLQLVRETLAESAPPMLDLDGEDLDLTERNIKQCKRKIYDGHYTAAVRVLSSSGVAPYNDATLQELKTKHPFMSAPSLPDSHIDHHPLIASQDVVLDRIKSFPRGTSCGRDGLCAQHLMDCLSGAAVAISDELVSSITQVVNIFLEGKCLTMLAVGTIWRRLVSKVSATMIGHSLDGYLDGLQFGVGVPGGGEAILHAVNRLVEDRGDDVGLSMLLVDFQNAFNLVDRIVMLEEVRLRCPAISRWVEFCYSSPARLYYGEHSLWSCQGAWYLDDGTIVGDTLVVGKVLELIMKDGPRCGLHLNVDKTELFWPKEDPRSRLEGIFPPNISRPLHGVKLLGGPVCVDVDFGSALLLLIRACAGVSKLYFAMRTCPPRVFEAAQLSFDMALRSALERIVTASGPGFGDWQWRLATLPFAFGGLGVYSAGDVLNYAFIASRLQFAALQTKLLRHVGLVAYGSTFDDALCVFNASMKIDFLCNPSEIAAPKLMKKMTDIYFTRVAKDAESSFSLSTRQMALWLSQREEHTSDWLRVVPIFGLGQTMNGKTYRCVLCYRLGVPRFSVSKLCSACSKVFIGDVYGDHAVSCAGVIGIKHRHNAVRDTLVDICFRSGISAGKEVDIGLSGDGDKALRHADILLINFMPHAYLCVDLTGSSPLTQTGMTDFAPAIGYGFLPFSFSSLGELEANAVTLLKRIRKFSMVQDIGARAAIHIFNRISFAIAKGVGAQIVSRLPSNLFVVHPTSESWYLVAIEAAKKHKFPNGRPTRFPSSILPQKSKDKEFCELLFLFLNKNIRKKSICKIRLPQIYDKAFMTSCGWLVTLREDHAPQLINPLSRETINLPKFDIIPLLIYATNTKLILALGLEYCPLKEFSTIDEFCTWIASVDKDHVGGGVCYCDGFGVLWGGQRGGKEGGIEVWRERFVEDVQCFKNNCGFVTNGPPSIQLLLQI
ncbi:hypothetical protein Tco_0932627 [Tanacetum coccineum]